MHQNASHIYVGEGEQTSVWRARWGGGGEPCAVESGGGGGGRHRSGGGEDQRRAVSMVAEETGVERRCIESVAPTGGDVEF
jgi:hypothetical protein